MCSVSASPKTTGFQPSPRMDLDPCFTLVLPLCPTSEPPTPPGLGDARTAWGAESPQCCGVPSPELALFEPKPSLGPTFPFCLM